MEDESLFYYILFKFSLYAYRKHSMNILINHFTAVSGQWTTVV